MSDVGLYKRLLSFAAPYWPYILAILVIDLLATPLALLSPIPLKIAVDYVLGSQPVPELMRALVPDFVLQDQGSLLLFAAVLIVVLKLLARGQKLGSSLLRTYGSEKVVLALQSRLFHHAQHLSLTYHDQVGTADSVYRVQKDTASVKQVAFDSVIPFLTSTATLVGMIVVTARIDWQLALIALVVAPVISGLTALYRKRIRDRWRSVHQVESRALAVVQEALSNLRVVKAFGQEEKEQETFEVQYSAGVRGRLQALLLQSGFYSFLSVATATGTALVLFVGVQHVQQGIITLGSLLLVMSYISEIYGPLSSLGERFAGLQKALDQGERVFALLDHPVDVDERPDPLSLEKAKGRVELRDVTFGYGDDPPVLRNVSFVVEPGTRVGVIGKTGSGKTTLTALLTRFFDPISGRIFLDDVDLREYRVKDLRSQFAIVLQEPVLFSRTIRENILYGKPDATEEEVIRAAGAANFHQVAQALPSGYDTEVGERGMNLSGGERQRVALARAFLRDAPVLILDEPTSSVDIGTEAVILEAMERLMTGRTTFIVAHRLGTLERCDLLLWVDEGRVEAVSKNVSELLSRAEAAGSLQGLMG